MIMGDGQVLSLIGQHLGERSNRLARDGYTKHMQELSFFSTLFAITGLGLMLMSAYFVPGNFIKFNSTDGFSERNFGIWQYWIFSHLGTPSSNPSNPRPICGGYTCYRKRCSYPDDNDDYNDNDNVDIDTSWMATRIFSYASLTLASITFLVKGFQLFSSRRFSSDVYNRRGNGQFAPLFLMTAICQGFTLLLLSSNLCKNNPLVQLGYNDTYFDYDNNSTNHTSWGDVCTEPDAMVPFENIVFEERCSISTGAKLTISSMAFWLAATVISLKEKTVWADECKKRRPAAALVEPLAP